MTPTLTDYQTGTAIRPATREEWQRSKDAVISEPGGTGAFTLDGRLVFVSGDFPTPASTAHTPEPWVSGDNAIAGADGATVAYIGSVADGERIVVCVNACEGIADPGAALAEVRAILTGLLPKVEDDASRPDDQWAPLSVRRALALLGAK